MKQEDRLLFVEAMEKDIRDHEKVGHRTVVSCGTLPNKALPIKSIWSFKNKNKSDRGILKHKAFLCAHGGMYQCGDTNWETFSPVVKILNVRLFLEISKIYIHFI